MLAVKNISIEGPGTLGKFLKGKGCNFTVVDFEKGGKLPPSPEKFSLILFLGGPMNVYEEDKYPFLKDELAFIEKCVKSGTKIIGLCLGAQMFARALGTRVKKNHKKEIGWLDISLTKEGVKEPLFKGLPEKFLVFQWHGDTFDIPDGATRLAGSDDCANQAFIYKNALGLQYHMEIDGENEVREWSELYLEELTRERGAKGMEQILAETRRGMPVLRPLADKFYENVYSWISA
ncbi:MAG: type 1 glutamine amidotransferase [Nitrospinae bacterium]|nr:type 1 glutamine amidotransferase [Nitrospinota bacterium]